MVERESGKDRDCAKEMVQRSEHVQWGHYPCRVGGAVRRSRLARPLPRADEDDIIDRMDSKSKVIIVGADYHGDWAKDTYLALRDLGVDTDLVFTNTLVKGTDNNTDVTKRAQLEKIKRFFRNHARFIFNLVKEQRRRMSEREIVRQIKFSYAPGKKLFVVFLWTPPRVVLLRTLKKIQGITLVLWQGESPTLDANWPPTFPYFDHFLSVGEEWLELLPEEVKKKARFLPLASSPEKFFPLKEKMKDEKFASDIAFVGYYRPRRAEMLSGLKDYDLKIYGYWWENGMKEFPWVKEKYFGPLSNEDANRVFNGGKIEIGRSPTEPEFPYSISITQRPFDISLAGNFQLSGYAPAMEKIFGDSVPMFHNDEELKKMVDYYLSHPEEREHLAAKAHTIVLNGHTYAHRAKALVEILGI
jgi:hypothetical protein